MDLREQLQRALGSAFTLERELGGGGMSRVFVARDEALGREIVVKILPPELAAEISVERFTREVRVAAALQHPHIVPVLTAGDARPAHGEGPGLPYYTMPFVKGESLRQRLARDGALGVRDAVGIMHDVARALAYAHAQGVVHRDIKPDNILVTGGSAVVADFGIAKAITASRTAAPGAMLTQLGTAIGTPAYMAPEQAAGDPDVDARADLYAFGATAYEMLAGVPPFAGRSPSELLRAHLTEAPPSLAAKRPELPAPLVAIVNACLAKSPADRPTGADEVLRELDSVSTPAPSTLAAVPAAQRPSTRATRASRAAVIVVIVVIAAALAVWAAIGRREPALDPARVLVLRPTTSTNDPALAAVAEMTPDVVTRGFSEMPWVKIASAPNGAGAPTSERDLRSLGRSVGAGTIVTGALYALGDSVQVQFRIVDGRTGAVIRALAPAGAPRGAARDALTAAADRLLSAVGFVSAPYLGAAALPLGEPPGFAAFREFEAATALIGDAGNPVGLTTDTALYNKVEGRLTHAIALDTGFLQPRLWRGVRLAWNYRYPWVIAALDSILPWTRGARSRMTPYESALAECIVGSVNGINDNALDALRLLARISPNSPFPGMIASTLADINRPRAALVVAREWYDAHRGRDSAGVFVERRYWSTVADLQHYIGDHKAELAAARKARATAPDNSGLLRRELAALAALGDTATLEPLLDELSTVAKGNALFGFVGDIYLIVGQELITHGHPAAGARVLRRGEAWFDRRRNGPEWTGQVPLRAAILYHVLGRDDEALAISRELSRRDPADVRYRGAAARFLAARGDTAGVRRELAWLASLSVQQYQGANTYERAAITANLGRAHWDEAIALLEESLTQGQAFGVRSRLHYFGDWLPMRDYPPFRRVIEPKG
jgi:tRNA A-37 threonylcarbamoyl transferase component Bud32/tetratricopeptide (TPR) repeat protein/TolB-like protein